KKKGNPGELVLIQCLLLSTLQLVKHAVGNAAQKLSGELVAEFPGLSDLEKCRNRGRTQLFLDLSLRQIERLVDRIAGRRHLQNRHKASICELFYIHFWRIGKPELFFLVKTGIRPTSLAVP